MAKYHYAEFGDILQEPETGLLFAVVSGTTAVKRHKLFLVLLEVDPAFNSLGFGPKPFDRPDIAKMVFVENQQKKIQSFVDGTGIKSDAKAVKDFAFPTRLPTKKLIPA